MLALAVAVAIASCAPLPPPRGAPVPPSRPREHPAPGAARPAAPAPLRIDREPRIDVGLAWDLDSLTLAPAAARMTWWVEGGRERGRSAVVQLRLSRPGPGFNLWSAGRLVAGPLATTDTLWLGDDAASGPDGAPSIRWHAKTWRGRAKVFVGPRGRLTLAVRIPLESYLAGVVPGEIGGLTEPQIQAGRAQAIAARSYTLYYRGRRGSEGFDLYASVEDQVYGPIESERPLATQCVESTRGQFALFQDQPIRANYCSTCGGITAEVWEGWPAASLPYLRSQRDGGDHGDFCAGSPQYRWREEWSAADFLKTIARYASAESVELPAPGMGDLVDVAVTSRSRSGRVWRMLVTTTTGEIEIPAYAIRRVLRRPGDGLQVLRSNLFKVAVRRDAGTRRASAVVASGAGSGHGVGLCQTGSLGMARDGFSGEKILEHYYPGVTLKRLYR